MKRRPFRARLESLEDRCVPATYWATGSDLGQPGTALLVDAATGQPRFTVTPFGSGFTGGVRVAVGDVNGDTIPDLIVGAGAGGGPQISVYNGANGNLLTTFFAFETAYRAGVVVAAGDVNADRYADIIVGSSAGAARVSVFDGKTGAEYSTLFAYEPTFLGGVTVASADVNADGRADVIVGAGKGGAPRVRALSGATGAELFNAFAFDSSFRDGVNVAGGDVNRDGLADIIAGAGVGGAPHVRWIGGDGDAEGSFFSGNSSLRNGTKVGFLATETGAPRIVATDGARGGVGLFDVHGTEVGRTAGVDGTQARTSDTVLAWVDILLRSLLENKTAPTKAARALGVFGGAVFDSVNSITGDYTQYRITVPVTGPASVDAAAATAAARTLQYLFPTQTARFESALTGSLAAIPDGPAKTTGISVGETVAADMIAWRRTDGAGTSVPYTPGTDPGDYQLTPQAFAQPLSPEWPNLTPFTMTSGSQFRPAAPPALTSAEYTRDFEEVGLYGDALSTVRSAEQTLIGHFWSDLPVGNSAAPPGHWFRIAADVSRTQGLSLSENARLFGLLGIAEADASIVSWDAKYFFDLWRPITAIRAADTDGNPDTIANSIWTPLWATPAFQSYTSGHSTFSGTGATILDSIFGANTPFTTGTDDLADVARSFDNFQEAAAEAGQSRIYGGIHFQFDNTAGLSSGRALGQYIAANFLRAANQAEAGMTDTLPSLTDSGWVDIGNGLRMRDVVVGTGTPVVTGQVITVHYTGWLDNGTVIDSSRRSLNPRASGDPVTFDLDNLIQGWQKGVPGMRPGGIRQLDIPAALAYGATGSPPTIPANARLVFEIKLL